MSLTPYLAQRKSLVDETLERLLPPPVGPASVVIDALRYAVQAGGKRLRPVLAMAACEACGGRADDALEPGCAIELLHTYSLIHDDLPSMDDDDLRRGRPTTHCAFGEATAILAGDALQTLAFEWLSRLPATADPARRVACVEVLARAAGVAGMVGGQMADLAAEHDAVDAEGLGWIHRHKTGALLGASAEIGAIHAGADSRLRGSMARFGLALGLAFQIADDILDVTSTVDRLGKTPGKDRRAGKATYPAMIGLAAARDEAERCLRKALAHLEALDEAAETLRALARFAVSRSA